MKDEGGRMNQIQAAEQDASGSSFILPAASFRYIGQSELALNQHRE
jgi:hypothetical protein